MDAGLLPARFAIVLAITVQVATGQPESNPSTKPGNQEMSPQEFTPPPYSEVVAVDYGGMRNPLKIKFRIIRGGASYVSPTTIRIQNARGVVLATSGELYTQLNGDYGNDAKYVTDWIQIGLGESILDRNRDYLVQCYFSSTVGRPEARTFDLQSLRHSADGWTMRLRDAEALSVPWRRDPREVAALGTQPADVPMLAARRAPPPYSNIIAVHYDSMLNALKITFQIQPDGSAFHHSAARASSVTVYQADGEAPPQSSPPSRDLVSRLNTNPGGTPTYEVEVDVTGISLDPAREYEIETRFHSNHGAPDTRIYRLYHEDGQWRHELLPQIGPPEPDDGSRSP